MTFRDSNAESGDGEENEIPPGLDDEEESDEFHHGHQADIPDNFEEK